MAFVGYRDVCDDPKQRLAVLDFVRSSVSAENQEFCSFLGSMEAGGGGDDCEDVLTGMDAAVDLNWTSNNRTYVLAIQINLFSCRSHWYFILRLFHIADMPAHGDRFHASNVTDNHPHFDSKHPLGLTMEDLISRMKRKKIDYSFCKITRNTDKMVRVMRQIGGKDFVALLSLEDPRKLPKMAMDSLSRSIESKSKGALKRKAQHKEGNKSKRRMKCLRLDREEPEWMMVPLRKMKVRNRRFFYLFI